MKKILILAFALTIARSPFAQQPISTPQELKAACENSPGNIVTISQSTNVSLPSFPPPPLVTVNCPCTLVLTNEATVAFEYSRLQFAGPLTFQSAGKGEVKVIKSSLRSPSLSFVLGGSNSALSTSESLLQALSGNISITLGQQAKMELYGRLPGTTFGFSAPGVISINGGSQFTGSVTDMGISGSQGVQIHADGEEAKLKFENAILRADQGSAGIIANGRKNSLEIMEAEFQVLNSSDIHFGGEEAGLKIIETVFWGPSYDFPTTGGVTIVAGAGTQSNTKIELSQVIARHVAGFSVSSSFGGEKGNVKMEKSAMIVDGDILFRTGSLGSTEVKENSLTSSTKITIKTGAGGNCIAAPNRNLNAPVVEACIPGPTARKSQQIETVSGAMEVNVFPNPAINGTFNVNMGCSGVPKRITIIDITGKIVRQWQSFPGTTMMVSGLAPGFYNVTVVNGTDGLRSIKKVVIPGG